MSPVVSGPARGSPSDVARRAAAVIAVTVAFGIGLYFFWSIRTIILWVVVAAVLAFALEPAVRWLMSKGMGRALPRSSSRLPRCWRRPASSPS